MPAWSLRLANATGEFKLAPSAVCSPGSMFGHGPRVEIGSPASVVSSSCLGRAIAGIVIVATWNINGIRARLPRMQEWLAERKPDIVCLQELKITDADFPHAALEEAGYFAATFGQPSWNGVAVLARQRPEVRLSGLPGAEGQGARFLVARVGAMDVASMYVPNGRTTADPEFRQKLAWLDSLAAWLTSRSEADRPFIIAGDINVCPADIDSFAGSAARGTIFHTDEERALIARVQAAGLVDLFRVKHPDLPGFSWWDYRAGCFHKNEGLRIDLLYGSDHVGRRVRDVFVDRDYRKKSKTSGAVPSDHAPVVAILEDEG